MLKWPVRAFDAVVKLFQPLQDIDVYVEDIHDHVFYSYCLQRFAPDGIKIQRVFPLGNRQAVIAAAQAQNQPLGRRALYLIDGDLEWVKDAPAPVGHALHRIDAYCIENLLIDEAALAQLIAEEALLTEVDSFNALGFSIWVNTHERLLIELFAAFATVNEFDAGYATVGGGVGNLCSGGNQPTIDPAKVAVCRDAALSHAVKVGGGANAYAFYYKCLRRLVALPFPLDAVSGKDFVLPLIDFHLRMNNCKIARRTLRLRLGMKGNPARAPGVVDAIRQASMGNL